MCMIKYCLENWGIEHLTFRSSDNILSYTFHNYTRIWLDCFIFSRWAVRFIKNPKLMLWGLGLVSIGTHIFLLCRESKTATHIKIWSGHNYKNKRKKYTRQSQIKRVVCFFPIPLLGCVLSMIYKKEGMQRYGEGPSKIKWRESMKTLVKNKERKKGRAWRGSLNFPTVP